MEYKCEFVETLLTNKYKSKFPQILNLFLYYFVWISRFVDNYMYMYIITIIAQSL